MSDGALIFDFPAESGQRRVQAVVDRQAAAVVKALKRRRTGSRLPAFHDAQRWAELDAEGVNGYLKQHTGGPFTVKDFRTWNATVLAAVALAGTDRDRARGAARERAVRGAVKSVADHLGNTPAVSRASYIDPGVIDRFCAGATIADALARVTVSDLPHRRAPERVES